MLFGPSGSSSWRGWTLLRGYNKQTSVWNNRWEMKRLRYDMKTLLHGDKENGETECRRVRLVGLERERVVCACIYAIESRHIRTSN